MASTVNFAFAGPTLSTVSIAAAIIAVSGALRVVGIKTLPTVLFPTLLYSTSIVHCCTGKCTHKTFSRQ